MSHVGVRIAPKLPLRAGGMVQVARCYAAAAPPTSVGGPGGPGGAGATAAKPAAAAGAKPQSSLLLGLAAWTAAGAGSYYYFQDYFDEAISPALSKSKTDQVKVKPAEPVVVDPAIQEREERQRQELRKKALKDAVSLALKKAIDAAAGPNPEPAVVEDLRAALLAAEAEEVVPDMSLQAQERLQRIAVLQQLREDLKSAHEELVEAIRVRSLTLGREALGKLRLVQQKLSPDEADAIIRGIAVHLDIHETQLNNLELAELSVARLLTQRVELQAAFRANDLEIARMAMEAVLGTEMTLNDLQEAYPREEAWMQESMVRLQEMERIERETVARALALARLEAAVSERKAQECAEALAEARAVGLESSPTMEMAAVLAQPDAFVETLAKDTAEKVKEMRRNSDLSDQDFVEATAAAAANMTEEQLQKQAGELAAAIMRNHVLAKVDLEEQLVQVEKQLFERCASRMGASIAKFEQDRQAVEGARENELQGTYSKLTEALASEVRHHGEEVGEAEREQCRQEGMDLISDRLQQERATIAKGIEDLQTTINALDNLTTTGESLPKRVHASHRLSMALLDLQCALTEGRSSVAELQELREAANGKDLAFVPRLLDSLPQQTILRSSAPVPTEPQLQRNFLEKLQDLKAAALAPPSQGLPWALLANVIGSLHARLYILRAPEGREMPADSLTEAARRNLAVLARAVPLVERGDLRGALALLDGLTGNCRENAKMWVDEARHALLLQQVVRATQAKARCLNAILF